MLTARSSPGQVEIAGPRADLIRLKDQIARWLESDRASLSVECNPACKPTPYLKSLADIAFQKTIGCVVITESGQSLWIAGSPEHLRALLWVFDPPPNATTGHHQHFYAHPDLHPESSELIAMVREQNTRTTSN